MNDQPTPTEKAREIAEKIIIERHKAAEQIVLDWYDRNTIPVSVPVEFESLVSAIFSALTRSEEEKKFSIRALETLEKSIQETSSGWHKTSTELQEAQNQLSTLTARLKEAEKAMKIIAESEHFFPDEKVWMPTPDALIAKSFLSASTPAEKNEADPICECGYRKSWHVNSGPCGFKDSNCDKFRLAQSPVEKEA